jgi:undecaprenyl pyrophosphate phosphatase UppP
MTVTNILRHSTLPHFCIHLISVSTLSFLLLHCLFTAVHHYNSDCTIIVFVSSFVCFVSSIVACEQLICWLSSNLLLFLAPYRTVRATVPYSTLLLPVLYLLVPTFWLYCTFYCTYRRTVLYSLIPTCNLLLFSSATLPFLHSFDLCFPLLHCLFTAVHHYNSDCTIIVFVSSFVCFVSSIVACEQLICWLSSNLLLFLAPYRTVRYIVATGTGCTYQYQHQVLL